MRRFVWLLAGALFLPAAAAATSAPITADVVFHDAPFLRGTAAFSSPDGGLDLAHAAAAGEPLDLSWSSARGYVVTTEWTALPVGDGFEVAAGPNNETLKLGPGRIDRIECGAGCRAILLGVGEGSEIALDGLAEAVRLAPALDPKTYSADFEEEGADSFSRTFPPGSIHAAAQARLEDTDVLRIASAQARAAGRVGLLLMNAAATVETDGSPRVVLDTRSTREPLVAPLGAATAERVRSSWLYVQLEDASFTSEPGGRTLFLAEEPRLDWEGTLSSRSASGDLSYGGRAVHLERDPLVITGSVVSAVSERSVAPAGLPVDALSRTMLRAEMEGEASDVRVGAQSVTPAYTMPLAVATTSGLLLALGWILTKAARVGLLAVYTRIGPRDLLRHPHRSDLYERIRKRPGQGSRELARSSGLARMVVEHHVQMLESHRLVVARRVGMRRLLFVAAELPTEDVLRARLVLSAASRRRLADALAATEGALSQKDLVERTRISQRLISYHLRHLESAGLVAADGGVPRRYAPTTKLREILVA
jgi:predicted transcriptional regulator